MQKQHPATKKKGDIMDSVILKQIKQFIAETMGEQSSMSSLRKTSYVEGYKACLGDVKKIIDFAESLKPKSER